MNLYHTMTPDAYLLLRLPAVPTPQLSEPVELLLCQLQHCCLQCHRGHGIRRGGRGGQGDEVGLGRRRGR